MANSLAVQRRQILDRLQSGPLSTLEARTELDIMHPAGRVRELKALGHGITTFWTTEHGPQGKPHRIAKYVLSPGA